MNLLENCREAKTGQSSVPAIEGIGEPVAEAQTLHFHYSAPKLEQPAWEESISNLLKTHS